MNGINNELEFEKHVRLDILIEILSSNNNYKLFNFKKAVDILIARNGIDSKLFFIEIKYHKNSHKRLGFGQSKGSGFQPELLRNNTDYFENNLKWILGNEDSERYWFVDNATIRRYLNGNNVGDKYNGIKLRFFQEVGSIDKSELTCRLKEWLDLL